MPLAARGFPQQLGRADADRVRPAIGIGPDRPAIQAPPARADEALPVGVKQHGLAVTRLEMGQFAARVGLPEADAIPVGGRHQPAVGADIRRRSPAVASRASVRLPSMPGWSVRHSGAVANVPDADLPTPTKASRRSSGEKPRNPPGAVARGSPEAASQSRVVPSQLVVASR